MSLRAAYFHLINCNPARCSGGISSKFPNSPLRIITSTPMATNTATKPKQRSPHPCSPVHPSFPSCASLSLRPPASACIEMTFLTSAPLHKLASPEILPKVEAADHSLACIRSLKLLGELLMLLRAMVLSCAFCTPKSCLEAQTVKKPS